MSKIVVLVPTYNEVENLAPLVDELIILSIEGLEILIIDDNSPDGTGALADHLASRYPNVVSVIHRAGKLGLGTAYVEGFNQAIVKKADYIVQMDADFSHQPRYIKEMLKAIPRCDLVICSRYVEGGKADKSRAFSRQALSWFFNRIYIPALLQVPVQDMTSGYRMWKRDALVQIDIDRLVSLDYAIQVETALLAHLAGLDIAEIPFYFRDRQFGKSKVDRHIVLDGFLTVWSLRKRKLAIRALKNHNLQN